MVKVDWDKVAHSNERIIQMAYTVKDAVKITGMSRSRLYEELKAGNLVAEKWAEGLSFHMRALRRG
jgi:hypothetical protein